jgi:diacylglycerol kinase (ATP)
MTMTEKHPAKDKTAAKRGLARIWQAFLFSIAGLVSCYRCEESFRQEVILFCLVLPLILLLPVSPLFKLIIFIASALVLIVELINSAIEAIVDKASPEFSDLAKRAKDMASAAVLLTIVLAAVTWLAAVKTAWL